MMRSVREKKRELWETRSWLLHLHNASAQNALGIREFLAKNKFAVLEQPLYSPDLAPCDFFIFPKLKEVIKGTRIQDSKAIKTAVTRELRAIPEKFFQECVEAWQRRLELSAFKPKEITLKATCCKIYSSNEIKHLQTQSRYFSNTPRLTILPISETFSLRFTSSTNKSNQISRIRVTAKKPSQQEQTFFSMLSSFSSRVCFLS